MRLIRIASISLSIILVIIGAYLIIKSPDMGSDALSKYVSQSAGGSIDTNEYLIRLQMHIKTYLVLGGILDY